MAITLVCVDTCINKVHYVGYQGLLSSCPLIQIITDCLLAILYHCIPPIDCACAHVLSQGKLYDFDTKFGLTTLINSFITLIDHQAV